MPLKRCPRSGRLFNSDFGPVHPDVMDDEMTDYQQVLDYLTERPDSTAKEISMKTGVTLECIQRMRESGRIENVDFDERAAKEEEYLKEQERRVMREA